jgi:hypothetical protein
VLRVPVWVTVWVPVALEVVVPVALCEITTVDVAVTTALAPDDVPVINAVGLVEDVPTPVWVTVMVEVTIVWDCVWV